MSKLERKNHKVFGINATETKVGQFGSANATTKITTKDVEKIQALDAWEQGWEAGAVGNNRYPTQQERTGVDYEHSYQIGYMLQEGVPEWNKDTTFNKGSIVKAYNETTLQIYVSLVDDNLNNPVTDITKWKPGLANSDLSNLTTTGEKHFLNKSQITNCILEAPNGVATYSGNVVTVPTGVKALVNSGLTNADGTIKNIEVTTLEEQMINVSATGIVYLGLDGTLNTTNGVPLVSVVYGTSSISAIYPYSPVELLKKSDIEEIIKTSRNPIGQPQITLSNTLEDNEIWLEGATVSRTTYAELFKIYGTTYGTGDGSTTFLLPNFKNRAIWGYNEFGYIEAGLPNITGTFRGINYGDASGAFTLQSSNYGYANFNSRNGDVTKWTFDASRSSSIYNKSSTVQPPAIKVRVKTRYK